MLRILGVHLNDVCLNWDTGPFTDEGSVMEWLNYHHLLYFWTVAREGTIAKASDVLLLAQPTISEQVRRLEESVGVKLFQKQGRNLVLTDAGRVAFQYADEIFARGREMSDVLRGRTVGRAARFTLGIADVVPKLIAYRLILPALKLADPIRLVCREGKPENLLSKLAFPKVDRVFSVSPLDPSFGFHALTHLL